MDNQIKSDPYIHSLACDFLTRMAAEKHIGHLPNVQRILTSFKARGSYGLFLKTQNLLAQQEVFAQVSKLRRPIAPVIEQVIPLGTRADGTLCGIKPSSLPMHLMLTAATGAGKTWTLFLIMIGADKIRRELGLKFNQLVLDFKADIRRILRVLPHFTVLTTATMRLNPLRNPPNVTLLSWQQMISQLIAQIFTLSQPTHCLLQNIIGELYVLYKTAATGRYPSIFDLHDHILKRMQDPATPLSLRNQLFTLSKTTLYLITQAGAILDCSEAPLDWIFSHDCILELHGLSPDCQELISHVLLWSQFQANLRDSKKRGGDLRHLVIIDEAEHLIGARG